MFTGIIESRGIVQEISHSGSNRTFLISSSLSNQLKVDQSVSHNGVCLTVEAVIGDWHQVTAIEETLEKSDLSSWKPGDHINIERCLPMNGRLDGHFVQGHVDCTATCTTLVTKAGSWEYTFRFPDSFAELIIEKGSISVNGISLTAFAVGLDHFSVAIIPYTFEHTNMNGLKEGMTVNLEFDLLGKYIMRKWSLDNAPKTL